MAHPVTHPVEPPVATRAPREATFYLAALLVFVASAAATVYFCQSMSGGMEMPGGWTMSMMWMRMPEQTWLAAAAMFLGMWLAMMVAMMLPSALPMLLIYRRVIHFRGERHVGLATALMACGYFLVWLGAGVVAYGGGMIIAWATMRWSVLSRLVPLVSGVTLIVCGAWQFTGRKMACLRHCRDPLGIVAAHLGPGPSGGWRLGIHHGLFCLVCCWALMIIQLILGVMSLGVMALIATVIAVEKLAPRAQPVARLAGTAAILGGAAIAIRAVIAIGFRT